MFLWGGASADVTDLTDEGNHQRVVSAVCAGSSAAFPCKTEESLHRQALCVFPSSSQAPPAALVQKHTESHKNNQQLERKIVSLI